MFSHWTHPKKVLRSFNEVFSTFLESPSQWRIRGDHQHSWNVWFSIKCVNLVFQFFNTNYFQIERGFWVSIFCELSQIWNPDTSNSPPPSFLPVLQALSTILGKEFRLTFSPVLQTISGRGWKKNPAERESINVPLSTTITVEAPFFLSRLHQCFPMLPRKLHIITKSIWCDGRTKSSQSALFPLLYFFLFTSPSRWIRVLSAMKL